MDGVVVSTSTWQADGPGSIASHSRDGIFVAKTWLSTVGSVYLL